MDIAPLRQSIDQWTNGWKHDGLIRQFKNDPNDPIALYEFGLNKINQEGDENFDAGIKSLVNAAKLGNKDAVEVLRSLCDGFARKKIDSNSNNATWRRFKIMLFAAYQPWERYSFLQTYPHVQNAMPQWLRSKICLSNAQEMANGNIDALYADAQMLRDGFVGDQSLILALRALYFCEKKIAESQKVISMTVPGTE